MKVEAPRPVRNRPINGVGRRRDGAGGTGGARFTIADVAESGSASATTVSAKVASVGSLLALQEVPDAAGQRSRGLHRAAALLARLDDVHLALLTGRLDRRDLESLSRAVGERRPAIDDPRLSGVLDEIEVRAAVELAKLDHA